MQKNREILEKRRISDYMSSEVIEKILQICPKGDLTEVKCNTCGGDILREDRDGDVTAVHWDTFLDDDNEIMCEECWREENEFHCDHCGRHYKGEDWESEEEYLLVLATKDYVNIKSGLYKVKDKDDKLWYSVMFSESVTIYTENVELVCLIPHNAEKKLEKPYCEIITCKTHIEYLKGKYLQKTA